MTTLSFQNVSHRFGDFQAVDALSLEMAEGEIVCLLGPSGCGKTTSLRLAAGLETLQEGRICIDGQAVAEAENPPGTAPPVSGQWPVLDSQQKISPLRQTGMAKRTSIRWVPPR